MESPTRTRRRQQPDETRGLILDTAERLLRERPFRELSVDEIMRSTGYRRTVFYRHFQGLPELVGAVLARVLPELAQANLAFAAVAAEEIDRERAAQLLRPIVEHWRRHGPLLRALRDAGVYDGEVDGLVERTRVGFQALVRDSLERRQAAGWMPGVDAAETAAALVAMNVRYLLLTYGSPEGATVEPDRAVNALATVWAAVLSQR